jgi:hypothetical protein
MKHTAAGDIRPKGHRRTRLRHKPRVASVRAVAASWPDAAPVTIADVPSISVAPHPSGGRLGR